MLNIRYGIEFMAKHVVFMAAADIQRMMACTLFCEAGGCGCECHAHSGSGDGGHGVL